MSAGRRERSGVTPHREALEALFGIVKMRISSTMDVHARVSILNHEDLVMDRSKTVRYGREIPCRNTRTIFPVNGRGLIETPRWTLSAMRRHAISPVKQPGPH